MPPKLKKGKKGKRKGGKKKKGKKKKDKKEINPPPLHHLTELYNELRSKVFDLKRVLGTARKKRLEGWYMTREMLNLKHDNEVYRDYLKEKMEEVMIYIQEITLQLEKERAEVDRLVRERLEGYERRMVEYRNRIAKAEQEINDLKVKLQEFEPLIRKLAGLMARLRELEAMIPAAELEANIKTRHLKNQYLNERAKLYNHLEAELFKLIETIRSHLMPILADHMFFMAFDNRCNRYDLRALDTENFDLSRKKELLLEKRNRLNMEKEYQSMEWVFNKLAQAEARKKREREESRKKVMPPPPEDECELAVAFRAYLNKKLSDVRERKEREKRMTLRTQHKQKKKEQDEDQALKLARREARKLAERRRLYGDEDEWEDEEEDEEEMEYYEDEEGFIVLAPTGRMKEHRSIMENQSLQSLDDYDYDDNDKESSSDSSSSYASSSDSSHSGEEDDDDTEDKPTDPDDNPKKHSSVRSVKKNAKKEKKTKKKKAE